MAACYLGAVRRVQPEGPYRLAGWSLGGQIAFEMARRLREQGQVVDTLVLFDVSARLSTIHEEIDVHQQAASLADNIWSVAGQDSPSSPKTCGTPASRGRCGGSTTWRPRTA